ncbi:ECF transporter S component [Alicyclobacillus cycloheptanicus]|uniref:Membrane protein n=1 Tax=Alicyclobacillus cycloheptanicus TaxID=1457 RepID=A0ABT9XIA5_9BACL|nr:ECF transporter S component [Alicyclobacillus cycloheptanicus]MDQ0190018.1 putative membrane protein [Alicyclobacillus cycloheptanicus]
MAGQKFQQGVSATDMSLGGGKALSTRRIVVAGVLSAISILLGVTGLGYIPVPTAAGNATIMHLPAVVGGILEGPIVGGIIGLIFGLTSFFHSSVPWFKDPLVSVLPRIFIGIVSYYVYVGMRRIRVPMWVNLAITGFLGSVTNTVLVLVMVYLQFQESMKALVTVALVNGTPEAIVSAIISVVVVLAYRGTWKTAAKSRIS